MNSVTEKSRTYKVVDGGLKLLIVIAFFVGGLIDYDVVPPQVAWLSELMIGMMFLEVWRQCRARRRRMRFVEGRLVFLLILISMLSGLYNGTSFIGSSFSLVLFLRKVLRFYLLMIILLNTDIDETMMKQINKLIAWLVIIQVPVAVVRLFIYGQGERAIGTYAYSSGGNSTTIPLIAVSFLLPFHHLYRKSIWNLLVGLGFLLFGIIGGKRGIVVLVPLMLLFTFWTMRRSIGKNVLSRRVVMAFMSVIMSAFLSFYVVARLVPRLNPDRKVWGRFDASHTVERVFSKVSGRRSGGASTGRLSSTRRAIAVMQEAGTERFLVGLGPGSMMKSIFTSFDTRYTAQLRRLRIEYGMTGLMWLTFQIGIIGAVIWLSFFGRMFFLTSRFARTEPEPYWRMFHMGMTNFSAVVLLISCGYNVGLIIGDLAALLYMVMLAFSFKRHELNLAREKA